MPRLAWSVSLIGLMMILSGCGGGSTPTSLPLMVVTTPTVENVFGTLSVATPLPTIGPMSTLEPTNTPPPTARPRPIPLATPCPGEDAAFVADVTIPDGTLIKPGEQFVKTWHVRNSGRCVWSTDYHLTYVDGQLMDAPSSVELTEEVRPGQITDISVTFIAPREPGPVKSRWQMQNPQGATFGTRVFVLIYAGTSRVDQVVGLWKGTVSGAAEGFSGAEGVSRETEIEVRAACRNGHPCLRFSMLASAEEVPFAHEQSEGDTYCFSDGVNLYCLAPQPDGTLSYRGGGPLWAVTGQLHKVSN